MATAEDTQQAVSNDEMMAVLQQVLAHNAAMQEQMDRTQQMLRTPHTWDPGSAPLVQPPATDHGYGIYRCLKNCGFEWGPLTHEDTACPRCAHVGFLVRQEGA